MRSRITRSVLCAAVFNTAALALATSATAGVIDIESNSAASTEGLGHFTGWLAYHADVFAGSGTLTVSLTNTSSADNGGLLTGLAFNIDSIDGGASAQLLSASHAFVGMTNVNAAPWGTFDAGAALGGNWLGGGSPSGGVAVGDTGVFEFAVTASDAASLTASNFVTGSTSHSFVVRFRGFEDDGSDKVPGVPMIPAPAAMSLLLVAGMMGSVRRRR